MGLTSWPPNPSPAGRTCAQSFWAALPMATLTDFMALTTACLFSIPPFAPGSGKFVTPCARMQAEYARIPVPCGAPFDEERVEVVVVVEPAATPGVAGPPHA